MEITGMIEDTDMIKDKENVVTLYACSINGQNGIWYYKDELNRHVCGEVVLVPNRNGYNIAQIVGIVTCPLSQTKIFCNRKYHEIKNIIVEINIDEILNQYYARMEERENEIKREKISMERI